MARTIQTALLDHQTPVSSPTANPPIRLHTEFVEIKVHTAKCDSCDKHNKLTIYRCVKCGLHVCSLCWNKKPGDGIHVFGNTNHAIEDNDADVEKEHENEGRARAKRRVHVVSDDEDDDYAPVLKPAPTTENTDPNDASNQHTIRKNVIMNNGHHEDHEDDLPRLWPMARRLPVLRPAPPAANTTATESANQVTQRNPHIHGEKSDPERQSIVQIYDKLGRQTVSSPYAFVSDQETNPQARRPSQSSISHEQGTGSAPLHAQRAIYRPRPGADLDQQAARNQHAFANSQPTNRQGPRPVQPSIAHQQATQLAPRQIQPAIYRPRPGADVDRQAARNQLAFADHQRGDRQAPQPGQASVSHQQATQITDGQKQPAVYRPRPGADVDQQAVRNQLAFANRQRVDHQAHQRGQASVSHQQTVHPARALDAQQRTQTTANMDQVAARNQQIFRLNQQAQAYADAKAKQMTPHNQRILVSHRSARPTASRDQVAAHNQQAFISNQLSSSDANYVEQVVAARAQNQAYHPRQQANCPTPGPPEALASHQVATNLSPLPAQAFLPQQHAANLASRQAQNRTVTQDHSSGPSGGVQVREHSPEFLKAADALLFYAGVEQKTGIRSLSDRDANGVSQLLNAAGQLDKASSARSEPRSSSKTPVSGFEAAETPSVSPHGPALNTSSRTTSAKARIDKHRARFAGLHSEQVARNIVSDPPASLRGHPSYRHATLQPESESALADSSAAQSHGSSFRDDWPHLDSRRPVSDHAATYLNQWNSGRAALSSRSSTAAVDGPATQLDNPRSPTPALHRRSNSRVMNIEASGSEPEEAEEVGIQALTAPTPVAGGPSDGDVLMKDPDVEILEHDESRHGEAWAPQNNPWTIGKEKGAEKVRARVPEPISVLHVEGRTEKHQRSEKKGDRKTSKELKASADVDVVGARKRNSEEEHSEQIEDDVSDTETTSWNNLDSDKTIDKHQGKNAGAKGPSSGRMIKKGIAYVKKQEPKGQKGKMTAKYDG